MATQTLEPIPQRAIRGRVFRLAIAFLLIPVLGLTGAWIALSLPCMVSWPGGGSGEDDGG